MTGPMARASDPFRVMDPGAPFPGALPPATVSIPSGDQREENVPGAFSPARSGRLLESFGWLSGPHEARLLKNLLECTPLETIREETPDRVAQIVQCLFLSRPLAGNVK